MNERKWVIGARILRSEFWNEKGQCMDEKEERDVQLTQ